MPIITAAVTASGKRIEVEESSLSPHCDQLLINKDAKRLSVEYAKARSAINEDFKVNFAANQALAKRLRSDRKRKIVDHLGGKVSKKHEDGKMKLLVTFPDGSTANL